jgi:hypothetical protein
MESLQQSAIMINGPLAIISNKDPRATELKKKLTFRFVDKLLHSSTHKSFDIVDD